MRVYAGVTHTIGGIRIDDRARVLDADGSPIPDLYAAGADAGGIFTGGYGSGLAAALVFGRIAAETALGVGLKPCVGPCPNTACPRARYQVLTPA